jgi:hypothetical protein
MGAGSRGGGSGDSVVALGREGKMRRSSEGGKEKWGWPGGRGGVRGPYLFGPTATGAVAGGGRRGARRMRRGRHGGCGAGGEDDSGAGWAGPVTVSLAHFSLFPIFVFLFFFIYLCFVNS